jgi:hypothetical protein
LTKKTKVQKYIKVEENLEKDTLLKKLDEIDVIKWKD